MTRCVPSAGAAAAAPAGAAAGALPAAASTSARTIRPPGPLPWSVDEVDVLRLGEPARERRGLDPVALSPAAGSGLAAGAARSFDRRWRRRGAFGRRVGLRASARRLRRRRLRGCPAFGGRRGRSVARVLALARQDRDRRADLHAVGALGHQDLGDLALVDRLELHRRLVGLDLGEDVARLHRRRLP